MKTIAAILAVSASALARPGYQIAGAAPPVQNFCQIDITLQEDLPRQASPKTWLSLNIWDKKQYMNEKLHYPAWSNKDMYDKWQILGSGEHGKLTLVHLTQGNNTLEISWDMTFNIDFDFLSFTYKGPDGKIWARFRDTSENRDDTMANHLAAMRRWMDASVKPRCEKNTWGIQDETKRTRHVVCAFKC